MQPRNIIFTGGGTGGHIFPAVAIANEWKQRFPHDMIRFIGAEGKMEMQRVPEAGYEIDGLPVRGLLRSLSFQNFNILYQAIQSYFLAKSLLKKYKASVVIGTGGFASLPVGLAAASLKIPLFIWEGNGYAGLSNKLLKRKARRIYCGFDGMDAFFPKEKWIHTGNPIRMNLLEPISKKEARNYFGFQEEAPCIFITGGSLGATSINKAVEKAVDTWLAAGFQVIWQTGNAYTTQKSHVNLWVSPFFNHMNYAYQIADVVLSRSGALSVSEIMACGVPAIFVPSPNVTDDHQTKNAEKAILTGGSTWISDSQLIHQLEETVSDLLADSNRLSQMREALLKAAKPEATKEITDDILAHL